MLLFSTHKRRRSEVKGWARDSDGHGTTSRMPSTVSILSLIHYNHVDVFVLTGYVYSCQVYEARNLQQRSVWLASLTRTVPRRHHRCKCQRQHLSLAIIEPSSATCPNIPPPSICTPASMPNSDRRSNDNGLQLHLSSPSSRTS